MTDAHRDLQRQIYDTQFAGRVEVTRAQKQHPLFAAFYDRLTERILGLAPPPGGRPYAVLEVATGEGLLTSALTRAATRHAIELRYTGTDLSAAGLELAAEGASGTFIAGDATDVVAGLPAASQDVVIIKNLLHHLTDPAGLLIAARRVLAPGGRVVVIEAGLTNLPIWVFTLTAPRREKFWFRGLRRSVRAFGAAGLRIAETQRFSWLPYELVLSVRFRVGRRVFSGGSPRFLDRVARVDDWLARHLPAIYTIWALEDAGGTPAPGQHDAGQPAEAGHQPEPR